MKSIQILFAAVLTLVGLTNIANAQMPDLGIEIVADRTALLMTDRQNDFLSPEGVTWRVVSDATAAAMVEVDHSDESALANFRFIANTVGRLSTRFKRLKA
jgi:hypothetical protein